MPVRLETERLQSEPSLKPPPQKKKQDRFFVITSKKAAAHRPALRDTTNLPRHRLKLQKGAASKAMALVRKRLARNHSRYNVSELAVIGIAACNGKATFDVINQFVSRWSDGVSSEELGDIVREDKAIVSRRTGLLVSRLLYNL